MDLRLHAVQVTLPNGKQLFSLRELKIPSGSHWLIQGESGKGKTTLLHLMAGLFSAGHGEVFVGGMRLDVLSDSARCAFRREKIGVIFQKLNLLDHLTVSENVGLPLSRHNHARVAEAIQQVNLQGRDHDRCVYLSQGEQQRVAVARVLAQAPAVILADEPTSSLDGQNSNFVMSALKKAARGKTLVAVSHDHRIAQHFDRVLQFEELLQ